MPKSTKQVYSRFRQEVLSDIQKEKIENFTQKPVQKISTLSAKLKKH